MIRLISACLLLAGLAAGLTAGIAATLRHAGLPVESVRPAEVEAKGSRPFAAVTAGGVGRGAGQAFKLPSGSKLLVILAILAAVVGLILATRQGRNFASLPVRPCPPFSSTAWPPIGCPCCPAGSPGACCSAWATYSRAYS